jgi:hypothetical protein
MRKVITVALLGLLVACSSQKLTKDQQEVVNYCAQENFQCESSCENANMRESLATGLCKNQCIDQHNACKAQLGPDFTD